MIPIQSALIRLTTAHCPSQIVDRPIPKNTCQESKRQCAERSDRKFMESGGILDRALGWANLVSRETKGSALCERDLTTFSWSTALVSLGVI